MTLMTRAFRAAATAVRRSIPEADQQERGQTDQSPTNQQEEEVIGADQQHHRENKEVEEGEETPEAGIILHVAS